MTSPFRVLRGATVVLLLTTIIGACGGGDSDRDEIDNNVPPTESTDAAATVQTPANQLNGEQTATLQGIVDAFAASASAATGVKIEDEERACLVAAISADKNVFELLGLAGAGALTPVAEEVINTASKACFSETKIAALNQ